LVISAAPDNAPVTAVKVFPLATFTPSGVNTWNSL
jgi:hypothetical protein